MPLRGLFYFTQQYEGLLGAEDADVYGTATVSLPPPEYIIFYNGNGMAQDKMTLYLSDSFSIGRGSGCLECTCKVINVRRGHNEELPGKCRRLWEYSESENSAMVKPEYAHGSKTPLSVSRKGVSFHIIFNSSESVHLINTS